MEGFPWSLQAGLCTGRSLYRQVSLQAGLSTGRSLYRPVSLQAGLCQPGDGFMP